MDGVDDCAALVKVIKRRCKNRWTDVGTQKCKEAKNGALNTLVCPALSLKDVGTDFSPQHKQGAQENDDDDDNGDE